MKLIMSNVKIDVVGMSKYSFYASYDDIVMIFGNPCIKQCYKDEKTSSVAWFGTINSIPFSIYSGDVISQNDNIEWRINTRWQEDSKMIIEYFNTTIQNLPQKIKEMEEYLIENILLYNPIFQEYTDIKGIIKTYKIKTLIKKHLAEDLYAFMVDDYALFEGFFGDYKEAMQYLLKNDISLELSMGLVKSTCICNIEDINSYILAECLVKDSFTLEFLYEENE